MKLKYSTLKSKNNFNFTDSARLFDKGAKPSESIKGIPYKNVKIGVGKEKWNNEKRFDFAISENLF